MRAVIQRVSEASVKIDGKLVAEIQQGLVILLGVEHSDSEEDAAWLSKKIASLRIFSDEQGLMNLSTADVKGSFLVVSQFTLHAKTKKGNRPSFIHAASPEFAIPLYERFCMQLQSHSGQEVQTGEFGANMKISLTNDGPVTILIDTKQKE